MYLVRAGVQDAASSNCCSNPCCLRLVPQCRNHGRAPSVPDNAMSFVASVRFAICTAAGLRVRDLDICLRAEGRKRRNEEGVLR